MNYLAHLPPLFLQTTVKELHLAKELGMLTFNNWSVVILPDFLTQHPYYSLKKEPQTWQKYSQRHSPKIKSYQSFLPSGYFKILTEAQVSPLSSL